MTIISKRTNIALLAISQCLFISASITSFTFAGLIGYGLVTNKALATVPLAIMSIMTALTTTPASLLMKRSGRKLGFMLGAITGIASGITSIYAIYLHSFLLFCFANCLLGIYQAFAQYYRYAATEVVCSNYYSRAISYVLIGGVAAAILGPVIANWTYNTLPAMQYAGAYLAVSVISLIALFIAACLKIPLTPKTTYAQAERPLSIIIKQPGFSIAILNSATGYLLMILLMLATPLAMSHEGFHIDRISHVIQWHLLGMYAPSFITGSLITRFGVIKILITGMLLFTIAAIIAWLNTNYLSFTIGLCFVGVGWNFMYIGSTTLLTKFYHPQEKEKAQAVNEFVLFTIITIGSLLAGSLLAWVGWRVTNLLALPILLITFIITIKYAYQDPLIKPNVMDPLSLNRRRNAPK